MSNIYKVKRNNKSKSTSPPPKSFILVKIIIILVFFMCLVNIIAEKVAPSFDKEKTAVSQKLDNQLQQMGYEYLYSIYSYDSDKALKITSLELKLLYPELVKALALYDEDLKCFAITKHSLEIKERKTDKISGILHYQILLRFEDNVDKLENHSFYIQFGKHHNKWIITKFVPGETDLNEEIN